MVGCGDEADGGARADEQFAIVAPIGRAQTGNDGEESLRGAKLDHVLCITRGAHAAEAVVGKEIRDDVHLAACLRQRVARRVAALPFADAIDEALRLEASAPLECMKRRKLREAVDADVRHGGLKAVTGVFVIRRQRKRRGFAGRFLPHFVEAIGALDVVALLLVGAEGEGLQTDFQLVAGRMLERQSTVVGIEAVALAAVEVDVEDALLLSRAEACL